MSASTQTDIRAIADMAGKETSRGGKERRRIVVTSVERGRADGDHSTFEHFPLKKDGNFCAEKSFARTNFVNSNLKRASHPRLKCGCSVGMLTLVGGAEMFVKDIKVVGLHDS